MNYLPFIFSLVLTTTHATAEISEQIKKETEFRVNNGHYPSIAIGLYRNGVFDYYVAGNLNNEKQTKANETTLYEIGSITKTFTGLLLAQSVVKDKIRLNSTIAPYWPQTIEENHAQITFQQLATHTSGLSRLPSNMNPFSKDPYAEYSRADLINALEVHSSDSTAGRYAYSNYAYGLLGESLASVWSSSYTDLIETEILKPMGLKNTFLEVPPAQVEQLATGYVKNDPVGFWHFDALAAAGVLKASISDLLHYGVSNLKASPASLSEAIRLTQTKHYQSTEIDIGLGWHFSDKGYIWHNGGTGGFRSMMIIDPSSQTVAVGLTNTSTNTVEDLVVKMIDSDIELKQFKALPNAELLQQISGTYHHENAAPLVIEVSGQKIMLKTNNKPPTQLYYDGQNRFSNSSKTLSVRLQPELSDSIEVNIQKQTINYQKQK